MIESIGLILEVTWCNLLLLLMDSSKYSTYQPMLCEYKFQVHVFRTSSCQLICKHTIIIVAHNLEPCKYVRQPIHIDHMTLRSSQSYNESFVGPHSHQYQGIPIQIQSTLHPKVGHKHLNSSLHTKSTKPISTHRTTITFPNNK